MWANISLIQSNLYVLSGRTQDIDVDRLIEVIKI